MGEAIAIAILGKLGSGLISDLLVKLFPGFFGKAAQKMADPTAQELQGDDQKKTDALASEEAANAVDTKADAARIAADDAVVRATVAPGIVSPAANAALAKQFPSEFGTD